MKHIRVSPKFLKLADNELIAVLKALANDRPRAVVYHNGSFYLSGNDSITINGRPIVPVLPESLARVLKIETRTGRATIEINVGSEKAKG